MRPLVRPAAVVAALAAVAVLLPVLSSPAAAEPESLRAAQERAERLAARVERLEVRAGMLGEDLAAAQQELGTVVARQISAAEALADLSSAAQSSRAATNERVRALYMSGGEAGLYATVLEGGSLVDVLARVDAVGRVLDRDRSSAAADAEAVADAAALQGELAGLAARQTELEAAARDAESEVAQLLAEQQQALGEAGSEVRRLTREWQAAQEAAAARRAALELGSTGPLPTTLPPASTPQGVALRAADAVRGVPYVYAGNGPDSFDCSGLTVWAYAKAGVALPRTSRQQWWVGPHPSLGELQPGDLLFWAYDTSNPATIHHVALYVGDGWMIHAPRTGDVVRYARVYLDGYIGATRPV